MKSKTLRPAKGKKKSTVARRKPAKTAAAVLPNKPETTSLDPLRTGMPALDSITGIKEFRKGDKVYRLIETNEVDEYEKPITPRRRKK